MRIRQKQKQRARSPAIQFVDRLPSPRQMPDDLVRLVYNALQVFESMPEMRSRTHWFIEMSEDWHMYSLLGLVCQLNGMKLIKLPTNRHEGECTAFLSGVGFIQHEILSLNEINAHTLSLPVLKLRVADYAKTRERMMFPIDRWQLEDRYIHEEGAEDDEE